MRAEETLHPSDTAVISPSFCRRSGVCIPGYLFRFCTDSVERQQLHPRQIALVSARFRSVFAPPPPGNGVLSASYWSITVRLPPKICPYFAPVSPRKNLPIKRKAAAGAIVHTHTGSLKTRSIEAVYSVVLPLDQAAVAEYSTMATSVMTLLTAFTISSRRCCTSSV